MALDPREAPQLGGCGEEGKAEEEFSCLRGRNRKLQGCLPSTLIPLPAAGEARCGNDWDQGPGLEKRGGELRLIIVPGPLSWLLLR